MFVPNLNVRLMCRDCKDPIPNIVESMRDGDLVCGDCGLVLSDHLIDTRAEWRTFDNLVGEDPSRIGDPADCNLNTDLYPTTISNHNSEKSQQIRKTHTSLTDTKKSEKLFHSLKQIASLSERLGLEKVVVDSAFQIYQISQTVPKVAKKPQEWIISACILLACEVNYIKRSFKEVCGETQLPKPKIGAIFTKLKSEFGKQFKSGSEAETQENKLESMIRRFAQALELPNHVANLCVRVVDRVQKQEYLGGKSPISLAGAVIYFVSCLGKNGLRKSKVEVAGAVGCAVGTVSNAYKIIYKHRETLMEGIPFEKGSESLPVA